MNPWSNQHSSTDFFLTSCGSSESEVESVFLRGSSFLTSRPGLSTHSPCPPLVSGPLCFRPALSPVCRPSAFPHNMVSQWITGSSKKPFHGVMYKAMCFGFRLLFMNFVQNNFNFSAICFSTHYKDPKKRSMRCSQNYVFWFQFTVHELYSLCFSAH
jgi:hypothetical protein